MLTLIPDTYVYEEVTRVDIIIASIAWGFTLGIGWLTTWTAVQQTASAYRRRKFTMLRNPYIWMIWGEISVCLGFGVICFMYLLGVIAPRCALLIHDQKFVWKVKYGVAALITAINISVYCIWIPARLQISQSYIHINEIWDRCEKVIYLLVDAALNILFIRIVKRNLVDLGLAKYDNLVKFNMFIICFSLAMDVLIVAMMSLKNTFVYMQIHPLAYIVKLNIEMSMASLIGKIARSSGGNSGGSDYVKSRSRGTRVGDTTLAEGRTQDPETGRSKAWPTVTTTVEMHTMDAKASNPKEQLGFHHNDTDTLLNTSAAYSVQIEGAYSKTGEASTTNGGGSLSSRDSDGIEPVR
ncbi:hypothetical protein QQX98_006364 [Neonectria punicea]|uniref:Integral membrane protein n=1 Tax=Neonectria punicea TaxID=979145 RepID=A0ABR1H172_9HYPO